MRNVISFVRRLLASLFSICFVITAVAALLMFNLERRIFDANTYEQALTRLNIYERMPSILGEILSVVIDYDPCINNPSSCNKENRSREAEACIQKTLGQEVYLALERSERAPTPSEVERTQLCLTQFPSQQTIAALFENLTAQEWETFLQNLLPSEDTKSLTEQTFEAIFAYLNGEADSAQISLVKLKAHLDSSVGKEAVLSFIRTQPPCTSEQIKKIISADLIGESVVDVCSPSEGLEPLIQPVIAAQLRLFSAAIPSQVTIFSPSSSKEVFPGTSDPRPIIDRVRLLMRCSLLVPIGFLLLITLFAVRGLKSWLRWWGWPLLIVGFMGTLIGFFGAPTSHIFLVNFLAKQLPVYLPVNLAQTGSDLAGAVLGEMLKPVGWEALTLAILGLSMIFVAAYWRKRENDQIITRLKAGTENPNQE